MTNNLVKSSSVQISSTLHNCGKNENKMCVCETRMPPAATKSKYGKKGNVMSVKCEEPIDALTVQVWLLYHHPNIKYCGWLNFRGVPIFVVFVEGSTHEFQYPRNGDFLYKL